jgi:hypothetical protein
MAQNEMKAMRGMPLRVRSMEGLGAPFIEELPACLDIGRLTFLSLEQRDDFADFERKRYVATHGDDGRGVGQQQACVERTVLQLRMALGGPVRELCEPSCLRGKWLGKRVAILHGVERDGRLRASGCLWGA